MAEDMRDWFSRFWDTGGEWLEGELVPPMDVSETDEAIIVSMDLPGVNPKEINIEFSPYLLKVSAERKEEKEEKGKTFHRIERKIGSFARSCTLPGPIVEEKVVAEYKDGVLRIVVPKAEAAKSRKVAVKAT
jgi:HSP20 family protein